MTGEISIDPKFGKNLLIKFKGGAVSLYEISKIEFRNWNFKIGISKMKFRKRNF